MTDKSTSSRAFSSTNMTRNCVTCSARAASRSTNAMTILLYYLAILTVVPLLGMMGLGTFLFVPPTIVLLSHTILAVLDDNENNKGKSAQIAMSPNDSKLTIAAISTVHSEVEDFDTYPPSCLSIDAKIAAWRPSQSWTPSGQTTVTNLIHHRGWCYHYSNQDRW